MNSFFTEDFLKAKLLYRPNRFVVRLKIDGIEYGASLPNPGKLGELFIPGVTLYVVPMRAEVKYPYRVIAVESYSGEVIMLDTHTNNKVAGYLINSSKIPSLLEYHVKKNEVTVGNSRFDFLLENEKHEELYCEIKSCTLFGGSLAMFPDAVTTRGRRHVEELTSMAESGIKTAVVFIIQSNNIQYFLPDFHTDPEFSETLYKSRNKIKIIPVLAGWNDQLQLETKEVEVPIIWNLYEKMGRMDRGVYIMLVKISEDTQLEINNSRSHHLKSGYYAYVDYESDNLSKKIERHKRIRKKCITERDFLRNFAEIDSVWAIRGDSDRSCQISSALKSISDYEIADFGNPTCGCSSHLIFFAENPRLKRDFQELLLDYRMRFLVEEFA